MIKAAVQPYFLKINYTKLGSCKSDVNLSYQIWSEAMKWFKFKVNLVRQQQLKGRRKLWRN